MKKGFTIDLEKETLANNDYRRVLYTSEHLQLVLMSIQPGDEIGSEKHELDQFIRIEDGVATVILGGTPHELADGHAVIIPAGVLHNIINDGKTVLKLYSVYGPPEHLDETVHRMKADEKEEHWDGVTSEKE